MFVRCVFLIFAVFVGVTSSNFVLADDKNTTPPEEFSVIIDPEIEETNNIAYQLDNLGWCPDANFDATGDTEISIDQEKETMPSKIRINRGYTDERIEGLCKKIQEVHDLEYQLSDNLKALEDNAARAKENEQSFENRVLGAAGIGAVGIGGMMAAAALSEQKADSEADQDMAAYLATFRCSYGGGQSVKAGPEPVELPGGNNGELMNLRNEYVALAASLKERKESLGMKPGIESEEILDKATMGLYDDENIGITGGAYGSLYRATALNSEADQAKLNQQKEQTDKKLKTGATVAVLGAVATAVGNYALNHNKKNKTEELMAKRKEIKSDYDTIVQELISECNKTIQGHRDLVKSLPAKVFENPQMKQYRQDVQNAKNISTLVELKESTFCK